MRCVIAEDEVHLADDLARRLTRLWPAMQLLAVVHDGLAAREALQTHAPQVAFLDIRMPGLTGLEVARAAPPGCRVVFVTAYDAHAVAAFELAAADYLLKPVSDARLAACVERLRAAQPPAEDLLERLRALLPSDTTGAPLRWLRVPVGEDIRLVACDEVCYFQAADKYTRVVLRETEYLLRTPLKDLLRQLDSQQFWQVHRATLVNVRQIKAAKRDVLGRWSLSLRDRPETLPVSRAYAHLFRQM